ncbi:IS21 family transposase [Glutamicibacter protophormiae]|uniref:IS21 family transposase n=1 Tax=Glutamicibacter protophormiae TaxID=37930 RepID=UPI002A80DAC6|nr:IS21 family transposase [Glutamicibacter protophormiae]WPR65291.1 IS21 family transposase [Glutamicibacter protophormiae]WPR66269.1 IS21 family transposase [Glutamicibacter protophormiae]WPR68788.1 IS21 family transposase [Glutamicibacter protophormiae]
MANYRAIMALLLKHRSYHEITASIGCSRRDISAVSKAIESRKISSEQFELMTAQDIEEMFPDGRKNVSAGYVDPHFDQVVAAMKADRFFTLQQGWVRYVGTSASELKKYSYTQYCERFNRYAAVHDVVATLHHEPGKALFVDWAGPTIHVVDQVTGEVRKAYLFVAALPYSGLTFCKAFSNMKQDAWHQAHVNALEFIGGVPQMIVPDNASTAVHRPRRGDTERVVNKAYRQLAEHYGTAIVPTRPKHPRDKAVVEKMVGTVEHRVIGYLSQETWTSFQELNAAIDERMVDINENIRRANGTTRQELFDAEEASQLQPLPADPFEFVEYKHLKVGRNYHVSTDYQHYSVPYTLAGKLLQVRITSRTVTIFDGPSIVCEHERLIGRKGQYSTVAAHAPKRHQNIDGLWSREWFLARARSIGPATVEVIAKILDRYPVEAQGYLECQNILAGLGKKKAKLEAACQQVLDINGYPTYTTLKRIIATAVKEAGAGTRTGARAAQNVKDIEKLHDLAGAYVRDADHYKGWK